MEEVLVEYEAAQAAVRDAIALLEPTRSAHPPTGEDELGQPIKAPEVKQAEKAVRQAHERQKAAEAPFAEQIETVWERNRQGVQDAKQAARDARKAQSVVEMQVGAAARKRSPARPVLSEDERRRVQEAADATQAATAAVEVAKVRFKDGVTVDQLGA